MHRPVDWPCRTSHLENRANALPHAIAQALYAGGDHSGSGVDFFRRVGGIQRQPQGAFGLGGGQAKGQQYMAGLHRTGGTGRARGSADPGFVQKQQQGFGLHAVKGNVHIAGQALGRITVQMGAGNGQQPLRQALAQIQTAGCVGGQVGIRLGQCRSKARDGGYVLSARAVAALLAAAVQHILQGNTAPGI